MPKRIADPDSAVERAAAIIRTLRGCLLTALVARLLTDLLVVAFPMLEREDVVSVLTNPLHRGKLVTPELANERARQLATLLAAGAVRA